MEYLIRNLLGAIQPVHNAQMTPTTLLSNCIKKLPRGPALEIQLISYLFYSQLISITTKLCDWPSEFGSGRHTADRLTRWTLGKNIPLYSFFSILVFAFLQLDTIKRPSHP